MPTFTTRSSRAAWAVSLCTALASGGAAAQSEVRISGTGSGTGGMQLVAQAFMKANPDVRVVVQTAVGSAGGIKALSEGKLNLALSNREPSDAERSRAELVAIEYARTPFVVAVHKGLGVRALTSDQLAGLFEPGAVFPNGQRARPVLRRGDTGDTKLLQSLAPSLVAAVDAAGERRGMLDASTDSEAADIVQQTPGAFSASTLALIESERRPFVGLTIDGREPTVGNLASGAYPLHKRPYAIAPKAMSQEVARFMAFLRGPTAQAVLRSNGHLPL